MIHVVRCARSRGWWARYRTDTLSAARARRGVGSCRFPRDAFQLMSIQEDRQHLFISYVEASAYGY